GDRFGPRTIVSRRVSRKWESWKFGPERGAFAGDGGQATVRGLVTAAPARVLGATGFRALVGVFTLSGAAGLVDQVCFSKYLSYVVGATAYAVSAVLAAFMTGLAVGATV